MLLCLGVVIMQDNLCITYRSFTEDVKLFTDYLLWGLIIGSNLNYLNGTKIRYF